VTTHSSSRLLSVDNTRLTTAPYLLSDHRYTDGLSRPFTCHSHRQ